MIAAIKKCIGDSQRQGSLITRQLIKGQKEAIRPLIQNDGPYTEELIANGTKQLQVSPVIDAVTNLSQFQSLIGTHRPQTCGSELLARPVDRLSNQFAPRRRSASPLLKHQGRILAAGHHREVDRRTQTKAIGQSRCMPFWIGVFAHGLTFGCSHPGSQQESGKVSRPPRTAVSSILTPCA